MEDRLLEYTTIFLIVGCVIAYAFLKMKEAYSTLICNLIADHKREVIRDVKGKYALFVKSIGFEENNFSFIDFFIVDYMKSKVLLKKYIENRVVEDNEIIDFVNKIDEKIVKKLLIKGKENSFGVDYLKVMDSKNG